MIFIWTKVFFRSIDLGKNFCQDIKVQKNFCKGQKRKVKKVLGSKTRNLPGDTFLKKVNTRIFFSGVYVGDFIRVHVWLGVFCLQDDKKQTPVAFSSKRVQRIVFLPYILRPYKKGLHRLTFENVCFQKRRRLILVTYHEL